MSYGKSGEHDESLAPLDPALFESPQMLAALAAHDIATATAGSNGPGSVSTNWRAVPASPSRRSARSARVARSGCMRCWCASAGVWGWRGS